MVLGEILSIARDCQVLWEDNEKGKGPGKAVGESLYIQSWLLDFTVWTAGSQWRIQNKKDNWTDLYNRGKLNTIWV